MLDIFVQHVTTKILATYFLDSFDGAGLPVKSDSLERATLKRTIQDVNFSSNRIFNVVRINHANWIIIRSIKHCLSVLRCLIDPLIREVIGEMIEMKRSK